MFTLLVATRVLIVILAGKLAERKGRVAAHWYLITFIYGWIGLLIIACAKKLDAYDDHDRIAEVMWFISLILLILVGLWCVWLYGFN